MTANKMLFTNGGDQPILLTLEPWADDYDIPSKATVKIVDEARTANGCFHVEVTSRGVTVWGWEGSVLEVQAVDADDV